MPPVPLDEHVAALAPAARTPLRQARFSLPLPAAVRHHNLPLWVGAGLVVLTFLAVLIGPALIPQSPTAQDLTDIFAPPSAQHPLGTDQLGRDMLARLLYGGRTNLYIALVAVLIPLVLGSLLGVVAGYFGGWVDSLIMRSADVVSAFPFYVLVIALVFIMGNGPASIFVAISIVSWVAYARIVRAETLVLRERDFVAACRVGGLPASWIITRHILPNTYSQAIVYATGDIVLNIGVIVTLSYFGMGIVPPTPDWGQMMSDGQQYLAAGKYALTFLPGACVVFTSLAFALLGDGLTTALKVKR